MPAGTYVLCLPGEEEWHVILDEALKWMERSIELKKNYNNLCVEVRLLAKQGDYAEALSVGERAIE